MKELKIPALVENIEKVTEFLNEYLESLNCPLKIQMKIAIVIDEIFSNISYYAYGEEKGEATIRIEKMENPNGVQITFFDQGMPYNPLKADEPDTSLPADERQIGGMGILMVKNIMDEISYEYADGQNVLKMFKII